MKSLKYFALAAVLTAGALAGNATADNPNCPRTGGCPEVYDPVICNDGVVYSNDCFARLACAKGCQPYPFVP
jgi:hypothetical protein